MFFTIASILLVAAITVVVLAYNENKDTYGEFAVFFLGMPTIAFFAWLWILSISFSIGIWLGVAFSIFTAIFLALGFAHRAVEKDYSPRVEARKKLPSDRPRVYGNRQKKEEDK